MVSNSIGVHGQGVLSSAAVVGPLDPGDDRDPKVLAGGQTWRSRTLSCRRLATLTFQRGPVGADATHRPDQGISCRRTHLHPGGGLRTSVRRKHAAVKVPTGLAEDPTDGPLRHGLACAATCWTSEPLPTKSSRRHDLPSWIVRKVLVQMSRTRAAYCSGVLPRDRINR